MNPIDKNHHKLIYAGLWLPVLFTPIAYMFLAYIGEEAFSKHDLRRFVEFILPFCILFFIHHFLLVRRLFMRNKLKEYFVAVICLLGLFVVMNNLRIIHTFRPGMEKGMRQEPHSPHEPSDGFRPMPPPPGKRPHKKIRRINGAAPLAMDFSIALLLIGANLSVALFLKYIKEKERNAELERNHLQQELTYLKAQINPHFFMNMLNNIHGKVEIDPPAAQEMIVELSQLMRYVLYEGERENIALATEVEFIATYVTLMRKRYSNKKVSISLSLPQRQQMEGTLLPPLLFIVIIENAFKHGISYLRHSAFDIGMEVEEERICFHCRNNRATVPKNNYKQYGGIGLKNLRKRLELLYGQDYSLEIDDSQEDTYAVTLKIPYIQA